MTAPSSSALLFEVFHAYLDPLLKKHTAGEVLIFEDLLSSLKAAEAIALSDPSVATRLSDLHLSQEKAYEQAATKALQTFASKQPLPPIQSGETEQAYVRRCIKFMVPALPNWEVSESIRTKSCWSVVETRAVAAHNHQLRQNSDANSTKKDNEEKEEEETGAEEDDGSEDDAEEDEEEDGELMEEETESKSAQPTAARAKKATPKKQQPGARQANKTAPAKKKQERKVRPSNNKRSVRGGRRGGGRGAGRGAAGRA